MHENRPAVSGSGANSQQPVTLAFSTPAASDVLSVMVSPEEALHPLQERVRKLTALCQIGHRLQTEDRPPRELLQAVVPMVAAACQHRLVAGARLRFGKLKAATANFPKTSWKQMAAFSTQHGQKGIVEVAYRYKPDEEVQKAFRAENQELFDTIAKFLRTYFDGRQAEWALKQHSEILDQIHDAVVSTDLKGRVLTWNRGAERLFGYAAGEAVGRHISFAYSPSEHRFLQQSVIAPLKAKGQHEVEVWMQRKSGEQFCAHLRLWLLRDNRGAVAGMIGYSMDITDRKRAEEALAQERAFREAIEKSVPAGIVAVDLAGRQIYVNPPFCEMLGWKREELLDAKPPFVYWPPEERERLHRLFAATLAGRAPKHGFESQFKRRNGERFWVSILTSPLICREGTKLGWAATVFDISERKQLESQVLEISEREQRRVGQDLHDSLNQHLRGVVYLSHALEQNLAPESPSKAADAARISRLVQESIAQAHTLAQGLAPINLEADGLMCALRELAASVETIYGVECRFQCPRRVLMDNQSSAIHLYRIAQEAVQNALRHGKASRIWIRLVRDRNQVKLSITDNGRGLPVARKRTAGMGLKIMSYRADTMGAVLNLGRLNGGTQVNCTLRIGTGRTARITPC